MTVHSHRDLSVWQKSMDMVVECCRLSDGFPRTERYGLCGQLQRAAVSIPSNVAEGHGRTSTREFLHHLSIAYGSLMEVETQLEIACRIGYINNDQFRTTLERSREIGRMLNGLIASLQKRLDVH